MGYAMLPPILIEKLCEPPHVFFENNGRETDGSEHIRIWCKLCCDGTVQIIRGLRRLEGEVNYVGTVSGYVGT